MTKTWIKRGLMASGAMRLAGGREPKVVILMYHSVLDHPESELSTLGKIMHETKVFRGQVEEIARYYNPVSMDAVLKFVRGEADLPRRAVAVTFDDGYRDNYEIAAPILEQAGVPGTFYITVDCVETGKLPWVGRLRYAFYTTRRDRWEDQRGLGYSLVGEQREEAYLRACDFCATLSGAIQEQFVLAVEAELEVEPSRCHEGLMMRWEHVRALAARGHIVGSHTMTHPNLAFLSEDQALTELGESKRKLEAELGFPVVHFSYPCPALTPHWKQSTVDLCRQAGYLTAVTTNGGSVRHSDDPLHLRRSGPTKRLDGLRWSVDCSFMGRTA